MKNGVIVRFDAGSIRSYPDVRIVDWSNGAVRLYSAVFSKDEDCVAIFNADNVFSIEALPKKEEKKCRPPVSPSNKAQE